ncbi:hypothetical protein MRX96_015970 [Rhipicephalus microplus]
MLGHLHRVSSQLRPGTRRTPPWGRHVAGQSCQSLPRMGRHPKGATTPKQSSPSLRIRVARVSLLTAVLKQTTQPEPQVGQVLLPMACCHMGISMGHHKSSQNPKRKRVTTRKQHPLQVHHLRRRQTFVGGAQYHYTSSAASIGTTTTASTVTSHLKQPCNGPAPPSPFAERQSPRAAFQGAPPYVTHLVPPSPVRGNESDSSHQQPRSESEPTTDAVQQPFLSNTTTSMSTYTSIISTYNSFATSCAPSYLAEQSPPPPPPAADCGGGGPSLVVTVPKMGRLGREGCPT